MSSTSEPFPFTITRARGVLGEFDTADRVSWNLDDWALMTHRLAESLRDTLRAYAEATGGAS